jgi:hypothetical protein
MTDYSRHRLTIKRPPKMDDLIGCVLLAGAAASVIEHVKGRHRRARARLLRHITARFELSSLGEEACLLLLRFNNEQVAQLASCLQASGNVIRLGNGSKVPTVEAVAIALH